VVRRKQRRYKVAADEPRRAGTARTDESTDAERRDRVEDVLGF
jgi:hypothetical protein